MTDSLIIAASDLLFLDRNDSLCVSELQLAGAVVGSGSLQTYCRRLIKTGELAETVNLICLADDSLISEFHALKEIFVNHPDLLILVPVAMEVPAIEKNPFI